MSGSGQKELFLRFNRFPLGPPISQKRGWRSCLRAGAAEATTKKGGSRAAFLFVVTRSLQLSFVHAARPDKFGCRARYSDTHAASEIPDRPHRGRIEFPRNRVSAPRPARA